MTEPPDPVDAMIELLREPVDLAPGMTARVMDQIARLPVPEPKQPWWKRQWTIRLTPLQLLAGAGSLAVLLLAALLSMGDPAPAPEPRPQGTQLTQFVLVAPEASVVSLVGDFNDWNATATPLQRAAGDGVWFVTVTLAPGRYRYAFLVDGKVWRSDPESPAREDEFGPPSSVVTVGGA